MKYLENYKKKLLDLDQRYRISTSKEYLQLIDSLSDDYKVLLEESEEIQDSVIIKEAMLNGFDEEALNNLTKQFLNWKNQSLKALADPERSKKSKSILRGSKNS